MLAPPSKLDRSIAPCFLEDKTPRAFEQCHHRRVSARTLKYAYSSQLDGPRTGKTLHHPLLHLTPSTCDAYGIGHTGTRHRWPPRGKTPRSWGFHTGFRPELLGCHPPGQNRNSYCSGSAFANRHSQGPQTPCATRRTLLIVHDRGMVCPCPHLP